MARGRYSAVAPASGEVDWTHPMNRHSMQSQSIYAWWLPLASRQTSFIRDLGWAQLDVPAGSTWYTNPLFGAAVNNAGSGTHVIANGAIPDSTQTFSCWFQCLSFSGSDTLIGYGGEDPGPYSTGGHFRIGVVQGADTKNYIGLSQRNDGDIDTNVVHGSTELLANTPYFVTVTRSWDLYINGRPETRTLLSGSVTTAWLDNTTVTAPSVTALMSLKSDGTVANYLTGYMGDSRLYESKLTAPIIFQMYAPSTRWELYNLHRRAAYKTFLHPEFRIHRGRRASNAPQEPRAAYVW